MVTSRSNNRCQRTLPTLIVPPAPLTYRAAQPILPRRIASKGEAMLDRYQDTAPPADWKPKSALFKWLWAKLEQEQLAAMRTPLSGQVTCPHCRTCFPVRLEVSGFEDE